MDTEEWVLRRQNEKGVACAAASPGFEGRCGAEVTLRESPGGKEPALKLNGSLWPWIALYPMEQWAQGELFSFSGQKNGNYKLFPANSWRS